MLNLLSAMTSNQALLLALLIVLAVFVVLLTVLGIVFIVALRKRAPVVKVVMAPMVDENAGEDDEEESAPAEETVHVSDTEEGESTVALTPTPASAPTPKPPADDEDDEDDNEAEVVMEGELRVRYRKSFTAKLIQLSDESKSWYSELKNEFMSYNNIKARMSWKRESFRLGRMTVARFVVRGKTLCMLLAVEPAGYAGTKYAVEDVSNVASTSDTPCLYRIKGPRRLKYAKEMIAGIMKELQNYKDTAYKSQGYVMPYEDTDALIEKGLVRRVVSSVSVNKFVKSTETPALNVADTQSEAAATDDKNK